MATAVARTMAERCCKKNLDRRQVKSSAPCSSSPKLAKYCGNQQRGAICNTARPSAATGSAGSAWGRASAPTSPGRARARNAGDRAYASMTANGNSAGSAWRSGKVAKDGSVEARMAQWIGKVAKRAEGAERQGQQTGCGRESRDERRTKITASVCELQRINERSKQSTQAKADRILRASRS